MIRRLLISTILETALAVLAVSAVKPAEKTDSLTAADFFANAPLRIFPTIDRTTRLDMLDYYRSGSDKPSKNAFKGNARVLAASPSQITFSTSDVQEVELSLIPHRGDTLLMVITTVSTPAPDSEVRFYTTAWEPVDRWSLYRTPTFRMDSARGCRPPRRPRESLSHHVGTRRLRSLHTYADAPEQARRLPRSRRGLMGRRPSARRTGLPLEW